MAAAGSLQLAFVACTRSAHADLSHADLDVLEDLKVHRCLRPRVWLECSARTGTCAWGKLRNYQEAPILQ